MIVVGEARTLGGAGRIATSGRRKKDLGSGGFGTWDRVSVQAACWYLAGDHDWGVLGMQHTTMQCRMVY